VLLSSHILSEVEALCDHVSIIKAGRTVESGTLAQLRHLTRTHVVADFAGPAPVGLVDAPGVHDGLLDGARFTCQVDNTALAGLLSRLGTREMHSLISSPPTLEELFVRHYDRRSS
jgi:ABC-2 type transport system ATP-binding protein